MSTDNKTSKIFAANLQSEMTLRNWSQSEMARQASVSQPRISEILAAESDFRLGTVEKIAAALGLNVASLLSPRETAVIKIVP